MSPFKRLLNFIYPPFCILCHSCLDHPKLLCSICQHLVACSFDEACDPFYTEQGWVCPLFDSSKELSILFKKVEAPSLHFLSDTLASLILFKMNRFSLPLPTNYYLSWLDRVSLFTKRAQIAKTLKKWIQTKTDPFLQCIYVENEDEKLLLEKKIKKPKEHERVWVVEQYAQNFES